MEITVIIDDNIIEGTMRCSNSSTIKDAINIALKEYISLQKLKELSQQVKNKPLVFSDRAESIRKTNRGL